MYNIIDVILLCATTTTIYMNIVLSPIGPPPSMWQDVVVWYVDSPGPKQQVRLNIIYNNQRAHKIHPNAHKHTRRRKRARTLRRWYRLSRDRCFRAYSVPAAMARKNVWRRPASRTHFRPSRYITLLRSHNIV